jgi:CBS domain containing-hemolysin-like protein
VETIWLEVVLIAVGVLANGFFAASEIALGVRAHRSARAAPRSRVAGAADTRPDQRAVARQNA